MAEKHMVQCRICKQRFDTNQEETVLVGQKAYYHKSCYTEWVNSKDSLRKNYSEDFYKECLIDYLYRDIKTAINFQKLNSQWTNFTRPGKNMTPKGIYFAVRYFYEVQKGDKSKMEGGIGIVPYIYNDSREYWAQLEYKKEGTLDAILEQMKTRLARPVEKIVPKKKEVKTVRWELDDI